LKKKKSILICSVGDLPDKKHGASTIVFYEYINFLLNKNIKVFYLSIQQNKILKKNSYFVNQFKNKENLILRQVHQNKIYNYNIKNFLYKKIDTMSLNKELRLEILDFNPKKIIAFDIAAASYIKKLRLNKKMYVWLGDLNFSTTWYHYYYDLKLNLFKILYLPFILVMVLKWKFFYKRTLNRCKIVNASNINVSQLNNIKIKSIYLPYPWSVSYKKNKIKKYQIPSFLFYGNLKGLGSKSALDYLLNKLHPSFVKNWGPNNFKIYICGNFQLDKTTFEKIKKINEVTFLGYLKNINTIASKVHACLFPIDVPVGNRSRIVTAMASGWPIIAHKNVNKGNPSLKNGYNCLLCENLEDFKKNCDLIYNKKKISSKLTLNAKKTYKQSFDKSSALNKFLKFIDE
jgi:hypothetical protein